ncbi:uncharacterized protein LOC125014045 [Mugil cephalus]|uniref:uncharacterized protein LOC125014045 n=1 Tax=Mugil cephalus TaxID=48193 RepID=UPI001FB5A12F|nr:uncharacterized protein LOC125014045 [Mugil cephalus]XP_047451019.1 uncharacterized protein LOC125014045 [Mugil cephalus]
MAVKNSSPEVRPAELDAVRCQRGEDEDKDVDCSQQFPRCPACNRDCDVALMLPCSHTMCGRCVVAGEETSQLPHRVEQQSACSVLCPCCRHPVELPCWRWSSATFCLPKYPLQHVQGGTAEGTGQTGSYSSNAPSPPMIPVDVAVDLEEEEMKNSVYGLRFALDSSTVPPALHLSNSSLTVSYHEESLPAPLPVKRISTPLMSSNPRACCHVCADVVITRGQYYWEVDVCNSSIYMIGVISLDGSNGWWLTRKGLSFFAEYDGSCEPLRTVPPQIKTLGVFLNVGGGTLSFHNPLTQEHLATLPTRFSPAGVLPALGLGQGILRLRCGLPPPPHVFVSKDSAYRGPAGAGEGRWRREVSFRPVRTVIQKFEELALSDSDSGLVSSFGSSCSTLASLPDVGIPGSFPSGHAGQETGAE